MGDRTSEISKKIGNVSSVSQNDKNKQNQNTNRNIAAQNNTKYSSNDLLIELLKDSRGVGGVTARFCTIKSEYLNLE